MTGIRDGYIQLDGAHVEIIGIKPLLKDAEAVGVAVEDLKRLTLRLGIPIANRGRTLVPRGKRGLLYHSINVASSKRAVRVTSNVRMTTVIGRKSRVGHYSGVNHFGRDGHSGPRWLSKAEAEYREQTFAGFGAGIKELLEKYNW